MGCGGSTNSKLSSLTEQTTFDDFDDEERSFNPEEFKTALQFSVAAGSQTSIRNVNIISLARFQNQNAIIVEYTIQKDGILPSLLSHMSLISTYISNGSMTSALQTNGFPNVSVNHSHCFIKFADVSVVKSNPILKVTQKIHSVVDHDYSCSSWRGGGYSSENLVCEMAEEVKIMKMAIISEQKLKKEDSKATPPEVQSSCPNPEKNHGVNDDTITKVNRQIKDISAMKKRDIEKKTLRDTKSDDEVVPLGGPTMSGGAGTLRTICLRAIKKSVEAVVGADADSVCLVSARASEGKTAAELTVVYTVSIKLTNVSALVKIITDALGKGRAKLFLEGIGWPVALTRGRILDSTSFVLINSTQKFIGLSLPAGCTDLDFTDPNVFFKYPSSISPLKELQTECRMSTDGDFHCSVNTTTTDNSERKEFLNHADLQLLHIEETAQISKLLTLSTVKIPDDSSDSKDKRVTFQNFIMRAKSTHCMGSLPDNCKDPRNSEYHTKYEEIVVGGGAKKDPSFRMSMVESKIDPSDYTDQARRSSFG